MRAGILIVDLGAGLGQRLWAVAGVGAREEGFSSGRWRWRARMRSVWPQGDAATESSSGMLRMPRGRGISLVGIDLARIQSVFDDAQRQVVLALLAQDAAQQFDVIVVELAVARRRALRVDQALTFEETDLGDRDVGKLLEKQCEHFTNGEMRHRMRSCPAGQPSFRSKKTSLNLPI